MHCGEYITAKLSSPILEKKIKKISKPNSKFELSHPNDDNNIHLVTDYKPKYPLTD